ncbi:unnamed protein product [Clavelina lepadiformis]|uniref:HTH CENPB-type domain-containing protein n=1 Tax=Clavelina lepadiformis TaxID=159417 RepID=A0ABP0GJX3_CLALP
MLRIKGLAKIISAYEDGKDSQSKRMKEHNFEDVDEPLLKWLGAARGEKLPSSREDLQLKAQWFSEVCGCGQPEKLDINWIDQQIKIEK